MGLSKYGHKCLNWRAKVGRRIVTLTRIAETRQVKVLAPALVVGG